ncbi:type II toxin-antitoxin system HicB family antitoxin [Candidatus Berkelbacteria bacterium]|nr:type II toxin-antitoxin system HicB family antitoxin [Candidatus Berkelbacteria bacterium]
MQSANKQLYVAIFKPSSEGGYDVSFPDFLGCVTFGRTFEEAQKMAREVLELWLEELVAQGESIAPKVTRPIFSEIEVKSPKRSLGKRHASFAG